MLENDINHCGQINMSKLKLIKFPFDHIYVLQGEKSVMLSS